MMNCAHKPHSCIFVSMLHHTKGIVLRAIKYGETSVVVTIYTELFGTQSYLVNGVRTEKKSASKANIYQPTTLLDLVVYHAPNKHLQRIKEARVNYIYKTLQNHIVKNTIAIYVADLINKTITEPESNPDLFSFFEESFLFIEKNNEAVLANFPISFTLALASKLGFGIHHDWSEQNSILDLQNGVFCSKAELNTFHYIEGEQAQLLSYFVHDKAYDSFMLNQQKRKELLAICIQYLRLHIPHLSELKSVNVLHEVLS
jgi:DNA repair protein RecO (recombination protein O)